jgi:hypothetical protein
MPFAVPLHYVDAYKWLNLSAANFSQKTISARKMSQISVEGRNRLKRKMSPAQIAEAQSLSREWKPSVADSRAWWRFW